MKRYVRTAKRVMGIVIRLQRWCIFSRPIVPAPVTDQVHPLNLFNAKQHTSMESAGRIAILGVSHGRCEYGPDHPDVPVPR